MPSFLVFNLTTRVNFSLIAAGANAAHPVYDNLVVSKPGDQRMSSQSDRADRRAADRYPIERDVRYKVLSKKSPDEVGTGTTINMSSSGVLFTTEHLLVPGKRLELAISWPAQLNGKCALKLVAKGRVVRYEQGRAAIQIQQYEFRTQGSSGL